MYVYKYKDTIVKTKEPIKSPLFKPLTPQEPKEEQVQQAPEEPKEPEEPQETEQQAGAEEFPEDDAPQKPKRGKKKEA